MVAAYVLLFVMSHLDYIKWLVYGAIPGVALQAVGQFTDYKVSNESYVAPAYCIYLALWTTCYLESWKRCLAATVVKFNLTVAVDKEPPRKEYRGETQTGVFRNGVFIKLKPESLTDDEKIWFSAVHASEGATVCRELFSVPVALIGVCNDSTNCL